MVIAREPVIDKFIGEDADFPHPRHQFFYVPCHLRLLYLNGALFVMAGHPDAHDGSVGLNLILIASRNPDVGGLDHRRGSDHHRRGLRDDNRSGLRDDDRSGGDHHRRGSDNDWFGGDCAMQETANHAADHSTDKCAAVVMAMVMMPVVMTMMGPAMRTGKTRPGTQNCRYRKHYRLVLLHIAPFPFFAFWRYFMVGMRSSNF